MIRPIGYACSLLILALPAAAAQPVQLLSAEVREFVAVADSVVALRGVQVIDGTGRPPLQNQLVLIRRGLIESVLPAGSVAIPEVAQVLDLSGHTVIPGLVGMHNHLFGYDFTPSEMARLYVAAGVTTIRTAGTFDAEVDFELKRRIDQGLSVGPRIHLTSGYLTGPDAGNANMVRASTPADAREFVDQWADRGVEWIKVYTEIRRTELAAAIDQAHARGIKLTGHLCAVTALEAAELGIDNIEHVLPKSDFDAHKVPDVCPSFTLPADASNEAVQAAIRALVAQRVAITSTLPATEALTPGRAPGDPRVPGLMSRTAREAQSQTRARVDTMPLLADLLEREIAVLRAFVEAGGFLVTGTDPVAAGLIAGLADQRNSELLIEAGFAPEQTIQIMAANGAKLLGVEDRIGTIEAGKIADLVVLRGDPTSDRTAIRETVLVFKNGVGYDAPGLIRSVRRPGAP